LRPFAGEAANGSSTVVPCEYIDAVDRRESRRGRAGMPRKPGVWAGTDDVRGGESGKEIKGTGAFSNEPVGDGESKRLYAVCWEKRFGRLMGA
jgi:hypothetical protein